MIQYVHLQLNLYTKRLTFKSLLIWIQYTLMWLVNIFHLFPVWFSYQFLILPFSYKVSLICSNLSFFSLTISFKTSVISSTATSNSWTSQGLKARAKSVIQCCARWIALLICRKGLEKKKENSIIIDLCYIL